MSFSSRSYRKAYSLLLLALVLVLGTLSTMLILSTEASHDWLPFNRERRTLVLSSLLLIVLAKTPTYPLHFWLPEAHVESTWIGSTLLACILLKFSTWLATCLLLHSDMLNGPSYVLLVSVLLSFCAASALLISTDDLKKFGAYLSVFHMSMSLLPTVHSSCSTYVSLDFIWFTHSLTAFYWFWWIGKLYSVSGSRSKKAVASISSLSDLTFLVWSYVLVLQLGLASNPYWVVELVVLATFWYVSWLILVMVIGGLAFYAITISSTLLKVVLNVSDARSDYVSSVNLLSIVAVFLSLFYAFILWPDQTDRSITFREVGLIMN